MNDINHCYKTVTLWKVWPSQPLFAEQLYTHHSKGYFQRQQLPSAEQQQEAQSTDPVPRPIPVSRGVPAVN